MPFPRTAALIFPFGAALALMGCSSASSTLGNTAATSSPASTASAPAQVASTSASASAVPSAPASSAPASSAPASPAASAGTVSASVPAAAVYFAESGNVTGPVFYEPACRSGCELSGDSTTALYDMTWSAWNGTDAVGAGTEKLDDCNPNCAAGTQHSVPVRVTFSKPVKATCDGTTRLYWTRTTFVWPDGLPAAFSGQNAPANPFDYPGIGGTAACS